MDTKTRGEMEFEVVYSLHHERIDANLLRLLHRLTIILMLAFFIAGASGGVHWALSCVAIAFFGFFLFEFRPGAASAQAQETSQRWAQVRSEMKNLSDEDLERVIAEIGSDGRDTYQALSSAARRAAASDLGLDLGSYPAPKPVEVLVSTLASCGK